MRWWRPFCCGRPGLMGSMSIPTQPPDGGLGKIEERIWAGEGDAVIGADGFGEAAFAKEALEGREGEAPRGLIPEPRTGAIGRRDR
jgi:hypothetical protein